MYISNVYININKVYIVTICFFSLSNMTILFDVLIRVFCLCFSLESENWKMLSTVRETCVLG